MNCYSLAVAYHNLTSKCIVHVLFCSLIHSIILAESENFDGLMIFESESGHDRSRTYWFGNQYLVDILYFSNYSPSTFNFSDVGRRMLYML